jgi:uncharacterized protein YdaL
MKGISQNRPEAASRRAPGDNRMRPLSILRPAHPAIRMAIVIACFHLTSGIGADNPPTPPQTAPSIPQADVLIVQDSLPGPLPSGLVDGNNLLDLLGHFGLKGTLISIEQYRPGAIDRFRFVLILGVDDRKVSYPAALLSDVRNTSRPVFWLNNHLSELLADAAFAAKIGFRVSATPLQGFQSVQYHGQSFLKGDPFLFGIENPDSARVDVLATALDASRKARPYLVRSGSLWYCADSPFSYAIEGDRYWVFCDILHDFFKLPHQQERNALVRIEDVSIEDDPDQLRELADYLYERHVPFQVSLIPIFKDPSSQTEIYLSDRPQFVRAIRHMVSKGGMIVMHGVTHQYQGRSGDDYEFWDDASNRPIQGDSQLAVEEKLRLGLDECFKNGIYPVTWETPHYMASMLDYQAFARYFNSSYDRVPSLDESSSGHAFPYPTVDRFGRFIIPEALGFFSMENPDPELMQTNAVRMTAVRDGVASFFYHPFMDRKYLTQALDGIERLGYKFISIADYDCRVQIRDKLIQTFNATVRLPIHNRFLHRFLLHEDGRHSSESYSSQRIDTTVRDPGLVPADAVLVMEGVDEISPQQEVPPTSMWEGFRAWLGKSFGSKPTGSSILLQPRVVVVLEDNLPTADSNDQNAYVNALTPFGFRVSTTNRKVFGSSDLETDTILVVPRGAALRLSAKQIDGIQGFVRGGGNLVLDTSSPLSQSLGIKYAEKRVLKISEIEDMLYSNQTFHTQDASWNPPVELPHFTVSGVLSVYARDKISEMPVALLAGYGKGRFLYLHARLDALTPLGYTHFPYFAHYMRSGFNIRLPLQRSQLELYFDPGLTRSRDMDRLAQEWRKLGVRAIYAGAYQFWPKWSYDYAHLIDVCHKNGILVYAWFELPHVSMKFWEDHPEWRAKTATGADGKVGWRYHMDLDIPQCQDAAFDFVAGLLAQYPWDGVNIAELNYDTNNGPQDPSNYLPMGQSTRSAFQALGGFDPALLFDGKSQFYWKANARALKKFEDYRSQRVFAWHKALLEKITPLAHERDMEIIVTMLDSLHSRSLTRDTGVDSHTIISLMDRFPFTLQVEDPSHFWTGSPERYKKFGATYLGLVRDRKRLMFDINVVPDRDIARTSIPTPTLCGIELALTLAAAADASGRAAIYSEGTIPFEDLEVLSRVLAKDARVERRWNSWVTESAQSILMTNPGQWQRFQLDGHFWPGWGENEVIIPAGTHSITATEKTFTLVDTSVLDLRLAHFTGNLDSLAPSPRGLNFTYDSQMRTFALFTRQPFEILVDDRPLNEPPTSYYGIWSVRLPRGRHQVEVVAESTARAILATTSLYSSSLIVVFGGVAAGLMFLLYMSILARRALRRAVGGRRREAHPPHSTKP